MRDAIESRGATEAVGAAWSIEVFVH
jgi:hypothetical protein